MFSCPLYSFDRAAVLHVWGRLWNSTFLEVRASPGSRLDGFWSLRLSLPRPNAALSKAKPAETPSALAPFHLWCQWLERIGKNGHLEVSFLPYPLGVHSREVPGSHRPSQHHSEVLYQELVAQRCIHSGELPARLEDGVNGGLPLPTLSSF